ASTATIDDLLVHSCTTLSFTHVLPHSFFFFFFSCSVDHRDLHSFPTRRSSDLLEHEPPHRRKARPGRTGDGPCCSRPRAGPSPRSEEHTSELQSRENLVCRLLLEKKKKKKKTQK